MLLRQLSKFTLALEGLLPQANRVCVPRFCHAASVKDTGANDVVGHTDQLSLSLNFQTADGIISTLESNRDSINGSLMVTTIDSFSNWYKQHHGTEQGELFLKRIIPILIQCTEKLSGDQAVDVIKMLDQLGIQKHSKVYAALLQHIRSCVKDLSLKNLCDVSNILDKAIDRTLRDHLKTALETELLVKLQTDLEENGIEFSQYAFNFIIHNQQLSMKTGITEMLMRRLWKRDDIIPLDSAVSLYASMDSMKYSHSKVKALHKLQNDLAEQAHLMTYKQVAQLLFLMEKQSKRDKIGSFYNEKFANALVRKVIDENFNPKHALSVLETLHKQRHKSLELLEYCCESVFGMNAAEERMPFILPLLAELAAARHRSIFWDEILDSVSELTKGKQQPEELIHRAADLMVLGWIPNPILGKIFHGSYKPLHLDTTSRLFCRIYQRLKLDPSYSGPLPKASQIANLETLMRKSHSTRRARAFPFLSHLQEGIKDLSCIRTDVKTRLFHELDYVVAFDQDGTPAPISTKLGAGGKLSGIRYIEDFTVPPGAKLVIIQLLSQFWFFRNINEVRGIYKLHVDTVQLLPYVTVFVNESTWEDLPTRKRTSFLMDAIKAKLAESDHKVDET